MRRPSDRLTADDSDEAAELRRPRQENAELRRAGEILKTASAFSARAELIPGGSPLDDRRMGRVGERDDCRVLGARLRDFIADVGYAMDDKCLIRERRADARAGEQRGHHRREEHVGQPAPPGRFLEELGRHIQH